MFGKKGVVCLPEKEKTKRAWVHSWKKVLAFREETLREDIENGVGASEMSIRDYPCLFGPACIHSGSEVSRKVYLCVILEEIGTGYEFYVLHAETFRNR